MAGACAYLFNEYIKKFIVINYIISLTHTYRQNEYIRDCAFRGSKPLFLSFSLPTFFKFVYGSVATTLRPPRSEHHSSYMSKGKEKQTLTTKPTLTFARHTHTQTYIRRFPFQFASETILMNYIIYRLQLLIYMLIN